jgi:AraC-like DNA-binding protein
MAPREDADPGERPASDAFSRFAAALAGVFEIAATPAEAAAFRGEARVFAARGFALSAIEASDARLVRDSRIGAGGTDRAAVGWLRGGAAELHDGAALCRLRAGDLFFLDLAEPFTLRLNGDAALVLMWIPRDRWAERLIADSAWRGLALGAASASGAVLGAALGSFMERARAASEAEAEAIVDGLCDLAAKAVNVRLRDTGGAVAAAPLATLVNVRRFVDRNLGSTKLDTAMIGRAFGLSRASLYRLFAPMGGVAAYVRKARLERARRLVASPALADRRVGDIARECGFRSLGVFNRAFAGEYGQTPSEARAEARGRVDEAVPRASVGHEMGDLASRLRELR